MVAVDTAIFMHGCHLYAVGKVNDAPRAMDKVAQGVHLRRKATAGWGSNTDEWACGVMGFQFRLGLIDLRSSLPLWRSVTVPEKLTSRAIWIIF